VTRTLCLRVYENGSYDAPLEDESTNAVQIIYAVLVNGIAQKGAAVPCPGFAHISDGVWSVDIDSAALDINRTDYYYVQYRIKDEESGIWGEWTDIAGYDPFFFNTKVLEGFIPSNPDISTLTPAPLTCVYDASAIKISFPLTYVTGLPINQSHDKELEYAFAADETDPTDPDYIARARTGEVVIGRVDTETEKDKYVHYRMRVVDGIGGSASAYTAWAHTKLLTESVQELIDAEIPLIGAMAPVAIREVTVYAPNDNVAIDAPIPTRGLITEIAIQFAGTKPEIDSATQELTGFTGMYVTTSNSSTNIPKPNFEDTTIKVYAAYRYKGLDASGDWIGADKDTFCELEISRVDSISLMSKSVLEAITDYVAGKIETSGGETLARKT